MLAIQTKSKLKTYIMRRVEIIMTLHGRKRISEDPSVKN